MERTRDYNMFKIHENNRKIDEQNLRRLKISLQSRNMLHLRPIIVNSSLEVIDGQHRLEAARALGLDIYYQIDNQSNMSDIVILNANQKAWASDDYLNYYCKCGKEDYVRLKSLIEQYELNISNALHLFASGGGGRRRNTAFQKWHNKVKC